MSLKKTIEEIFYHKYTLMIVPNKSGTPKILSFRKSIIFFVMVLTNAFILVVIFLSSNYSQNRQALGRLAEVNDTQKINIETLEAQNKEHLETISAYLEESEKIKNKLTEIQELEERVRKLIGGSEGSVKPSRGGTIPQNSDLANDLDKSIESLNSLLSSVDSYVLKQRKIPLILPCAGRITSTFGYRSNPFTGRSTEFHSGIDIANVTGTPVYATADGVVSHAGWFNGYGYTVIVNHGNGYETLYAHNSKLVTVSGASVKRGEKIALMGSSGRSTGPHLHYEIRVNSKPINPFNIIKGR
jgi:murein DD-endopeptidase MepM/ murein hydrolase activator NlpD